MAEVCRKAGAVEPPLLQFATLPCTGILPREPCGWSVYSEPVPTPSLLDTRTTADYLADAEHFEKWADRVSDNEGLGAAFRRLANDARIRAIATGGVDVPEGGLPPARA